MTRLYLDHNVSLQLASRLRFDGHDVLSARDARSGRLTDDGQLLLAAQDDRVFVSHNRRDFVLLHDAWKSWPHAFGLRFPPQPGVILLDAEPPQTTHEALGTLLNDSLSAELADTLLWWHRLQGWREYSVGAGWSPLLRAGR